ncbi:MAG: winged helix-turn-helix domain-containing protein [Prevotella sp.]|nr:winged helix-turn-helix domain-containing protein [Prevotella sp.]MBO5593149.1 winged helix-turn-helix domain-containing protein [Prevotella sp.]
MKQQYAVIVLFALIVASSLTSLDSYRSTSRKVSEDMDRALAITMLEQQSDVISQDTIRTFNSHLQIAALRGKATLAVDTRNRQFKAYAHCSEATIFSLSDQRPAALLWVLTGFWAMFVWYRRAAKALPAGNGFGGLTYSEAESRFYAADGNEVQLTPMQHQLMEMFFHSPSHSLSKAEICEALWPKKPDANDTLYTLIRRLKPVIEQHSKLKIESDRSKAYRLTIK